MDASASTTHNPSERWAQLIALIVLYAAPALFCIHIACVSDPDIWWHLRTGEWILQHHAIPRTDPFTSDVAGQPWQAYSWLFELLIYRLYTAFGMPGIVAYSGGMVLAITAALHHLVRRRQRDFSLVIVMTWLATFALGHLFTPRPWMFTILFFVLEVDILLHVRRTGRQRELLWLPAIFCLWANTHIQFIDGLLVLGLAFTVAAYEEWRKESKGALWMGAALAASLAATCVNPYGWHIYQVAYDLASQPGVLNKIDELKAIPFRQLADFATLFLALGAAAALARAKRLPLFETGLFLFAAVISFRSQRDVWVMATVAIAILAAAVPGSEKAKDRLPAFAPTLAAVAASLLLLIGFKAMRITDASLSPQLAAAMPVRALEDIQRKGFTGRLYNNFDWGGYLIWKLRMPVSIDGRAALHGDQRIDRSIATWSAQPDWATDPQLAGAGLVVAPVTAPLTQLLRNDQRFQLTYEDRLAAVFVSRAEIAKRAETTPSATLVAHR
ncbi:hypothetical protein SAMN05421770_103220 [Granulicella rosea]|uniref:Dolichyl-phosphate-mannose-protein mannosyltransferase n=1 Tax=Granulicella rosea TaxID=474952 RepID=A0A239ITD4_9BACT|nr:hypothetical protein [Granulicella rosea]SNS95684.1 hypothetical protein SAMN05421770_103220 [Granulicella rosea]